MSGFRIIMKNVDLSINDVNTIASDLENTVKEHTINGKVYQVRLDENNNTIIELKKKEAQKLNE